VSLTAVPRTPLAGRPRAGPVRIRQDHRARLGSVAGLAALLALFGWFLIEGITRFPALADDEGTYTAQAWAVRQFGQLTPYTYWYDHPPLGWIQLAGLTGLLDATGLGPPHGAVIAARYTMVVPALVSAALVYVIARRLDLRRPFALLAVAAFGLSPLALPLLRQVYLDGLALPWALAGFALSLDRRSRLWPSAGAGACLAVAVLSKETMLLLVPAAFLAARLRSAPHTRAFTLTALVMAFVLVVAGYGLLAVLKGELLPGPGHVSLLEAIRFQLVGRTGTGSGLVAGTRSNAMVAGWFSADPVLLGGGCLLAPVALLSRTLRPVAVALLVLIAVAARPGYLPAPYVLAVLPWCALLLAAAAQWLVVSASAAAGRAGRPAALAAVAVRRSWSWARSRSPASRTLRGWPRCAQPTPPGRRWRRGTGWWPTSTPGHGSWWTTPTSSTWPTPASSPGSAWCGSTRSTFRPTWTLRWCGRCPPDTTASTT